MVIKKIILATLNARYTHTSIALRSLFANLKELKDSAKILEFVINEELNTIAEKILTMRPVIVGLGVYIWNARDISELVKIIKKVSPQTTVILGGPEASHEPFRVDLSNADYIIKGEGEIAFYELCTAILSDNKPQNRLIHATAPSTKELELPYKYYDEDDIKHRYTYIESSRGCPFECEFCLSSIDEKVRYFDVDKLITSLQDLIDKGASRFKFIDRTFNLNMTIATKLLDFFLSQENPCSLHFEVIPENFPPQLKERLSKFKEHKLQLEVGIQTLNQSIAKNINRKIDVTKILENIKFLQENTTAHLHFDLIVGLPGEDLESFGAGLNLLADTTNSEIQIGILKKLSGTTINRHDEVFGMVYNDSPPYEILQNDKLSFEDMQKMKRFARFWDLTYNSGNFDQTVRVIFENKGCFDGFYAFSEWIYEQTLSTWQISLDRMAKLLFTYMTDILGKNPKTVAQMMIDDITKHEGRRTPAFLKEALRS